MQTLMTVAEKSFGAKKTLLSPHYKQTHTITTDNNSNDSNNGNKKVQMEGEFCRRG